MIDRESFLEIKKEFNSSSKKYRPSKCLICGKKNPRFCNSHSVPRFVLKNIADNGIIMQSISLMRYRDINLLDEEKGTNNTGTFRNICIECDRTYFSDYENPANILQMPTSKMMIEMAIKNTLFEINKKYSEKGVYEFTHNFFGEASPLEEYYYLDLRDEQERLKRLKKAFEGKKNVEFDLFFWTKLDYVVPIAFQGKVVLIADLNGFKINNVFDSDSRCSMQCINICIFPLSDCSVVMAFSDKSYKNNYNFIKQFKQKGLEEQLYIINYIIFCLTESYYLSTKVDKDVLSNDNLRAVCSRLNLVRADTAGNIHPADYKAIHNLLKDMSDIPNLLSKDYSLKEKHD